MHMFKKIISSVLIAGQLGFAGGAIASTNVTSAPTPELTLFSGSIALTGQGLSQQGMREQLSQLLADYNKTAQPEGQADRMEQALVALNVYTSDQAHQLTLEAMNSNVSSAQSAADEMTQLASKYPAGAQFSSCTVGGLLAGPGIAAAFAGAIVWSEGTDTGLNKAGGEIRNPKEVSVGQDMVYIGGAVMVAGFLVFAFNGQCG